MKRIIDCRSSDFEKMTRSELLDSIANCEGRTVCCETVGVFQPMLGDVTNAEFAAAMGADILLLNIFDVQKPHIQGLPKTEPENVIHKLKELTGRPIGINLEPVEQVLSSEDPEENMWAMTSGRKATLENARRAADMGVNMILLTGNPGVGVTNTAIVQTLELYKKELGDRLILAAGKMHASGILTEGAEKIITREDIAVMVQRALYMTSKDGNLSFMRKGTGVVPADMTQKLWELAQIPTSDLMNKNLTAIVPNITKNDFKNEFNFESLVHVDKVDSDTLPKLEKMVDKKIDDFSKALNYSIKKFAR